jgi:hypothetical protein
MKNRSYLPLVVLAAVVALVLGSFGTATAGGVLTKSTVKKIATKVVNKAAPNLSVKNAQTATTAANAANATNAANAAHAAQLNGKPGSAYLNTQYQYRLPSLAAATTRDYTFPGLPAGNYFASYSVLASMTAADSALICYFQATPASPFEALNYGYNPFGFSSPTGTAFITWGPTSKFHCNTTSGNFTANTGGAVSNVAFTPVDTPIAGTSTGAGSPSVSSGAAAGH